jgi:hypothetical protein
MSIFTPRRAVLAGLIVVTTVYAAASRMPAVTVTPTRTASNATASHVPPSWRADAAMPSQSPASVLAAMSAPTGPLSAEPTVPRPDSTPCVVELFAGAAVTGFDTFSYAPPVDCPPPWSKVVFEMDLTSVVRTGSVGNVRISLSHPDDGDFLLFMGAPQIHAGEATWRVERDLTDYSALLSDPEFLGLLEHTWDNSSPSVDEDVVTGSARIVFYPPSAAQPAPRVPDVVFTDDHEYTMPRNIVRAYVEVLAQGLDDLGASDRLWYTCMPDDQLALFPGLNNPFTIGDDWGGTLSSSAMGCNGGSYREVEVLVDGVLVGTAPMFPWLPSNLHRRFQDTLDLPVPSAHAINFIPYRVDVTPIASQLDDGTPHTLTLRAAGDTQPFGTNVELDGKLFAYLDPGKAIVTGAVTRNTLSSAIPTVTSAFSPDADRLLGEVDTRFVRDTHLHGYVDTSAGRIFSTVHQHTRFRNTQDVFVDGVTYPNHRGYAQHVDLHSRVGQTSRRTLGAVTLGLDQVVVRYPLKLGFGAKGRMEDNGEGGFVADIEVATAAVDQLRNQRAYQRRGAVQYASQLRDHFTGRRLHDEVAGTDVPWRSTRTYSFADSLGDCYRTKRSTNAGVLTFAATGGGCPGGVNSMLWYVRPDGSPENMGWVP